MPLEKAYPRGPTFYISLWISLFRNTLHRALEYRVNFIGRALTEIAWVSSQIIFALSLSYKGSIVGGWSAQELLFFFGSVTLFDALFMLFIHDNLHEFETLIRQGTFDFHLLRPVNTVFLASCRFPNAISVINFTYALGILLYATLHLPQSLEMTHVLLSLVYFSLGFFLLFLFNVGVMSLGFWMTRTSILVWIFFEFYRLSFRPDDFYFSWLRRLLFSFFPAAFFISVPVKVFLGKALSPWMWAGPWLLGLLGYFLVSWAWKRGIKNYDGALS